MRGNFSGALRILPDALASTAYARCIDTEPTISPPLLTEPRDLVVGLSRLRDLNPVGVDVERADWDRYWRKAALIQIGGAGRSALVDPIEAPDLTPLDEFLGERTVVLHAMENDLVPLAAAGVNPPRVDDTAVAAALLGYPTGLETLLEDVLGITLDIDKQAMQRADWEARPLEAGMLAYAAADVTDLPELWGALRDRLEETGRLAWYEEEIVALRAQPPVEERRSWSRLKGVGRLDPEGQGRARALWQARERLGRETDTAPGRIVTDKALVKLAEEPPSGTRDLGRRGLRRQAVREFGDVLIDALRTAGPAPARQRERRVREADRDLAEQLRDIRAGHANDLGLDPGVLCPSRILLSAVVTDPPTPEDLRSALGMRRWQWEIVGGAFCEALGLADPGE